MYVYTSMTRAYLPAGVCIYVSQANFTIVLFGPVSPSFPPKNTHTHRIHHGRRPLSKPLRLPELLSAAADAARRANNRRVFKLFSSSHRSYKGFTISPASQRYTSITYSNSIFTPWLPWTVYGFVSQQVRPSPPRNTTNLDFKPPIFIVRRTMYGNSELCFKRQ